MLSPRFRPYSQCDFCMKMTTVVGENNAIFFNSAAEFYKDPSNAANDVTVVDALREPWTYFSSTTLEPYGLIFERTQYS